MANEKKAPNNTVELQPQDTEGINSDKTYIEELEEEVDNLTGEVDDLTENLNLVVNSNTTINSYESGDDITPIDFPYKVLPTDFTLKYQGGTQKSFSINEDKTEYVNNEDAEDTIEINEANTYFITPSGEVVEIEINAYIIVE